MKEGCLHLFCQNTIQGDLFGNIALGAFESFAAVIQSFWYDFGSAFSGWVSNLGLDRVRRPRCSLFTYSTDDCLGLLGSKSARNIGRLPGQQKWKKESIPDGHITCEHLQPLRMVAYKDHSLGERANLQVKSSLRVCGESSPKWRIVARWKAVAKQSLLSLRRFFSLLSYSYLRTGYSARGPKRVVE